MPEWTLIRDKCLSLDTTGQLYNERGLLLCLTLEDVVREGPKVYGQTAIPFGRYEVRMRATSKFGTTPELLDVPGFTGILIHAGNHRGDTLGCILTGMSRIVRDDGSQYVYRSREALGIVKDEVVRATLDGKLYLTIRRP